MKSEIKLVYQIWLEDGLLPLNLQEKVQTYQKGKEFMVFPVNASVFPRYINGC